MPDGSSTRISTPKEGQMPKIGNSVALAREIPAYTHDGPLVFRVGAEGRVVGVSDDGSLRVVLRGGWSLSLADGDWRHIPCGHEWHDGVCVLPDNHEGRCDHR